jgi:adenylylsulfate kinase
MNVLVISGSMGSGKTTVLGEASDLLEEAGVPHAILDLDCMATVGVSNPREVVNRNLAGVFQNISRAGLHYFIVADAIETVDELSRLQAAMPGAAVVVCRLTAALATLERRLRVREPGMKQDRFLARAAALQRVLDVAGLEHFTVANDGRHVTDVAREVLTKAQWITVSSVAEHRPESNHVQHSPIMCSLTPELFAARRSALLPGLIQRAASIEDRSDGVRLAFAANSETLNVIAKAIDGERQCCAFLRFHLAIEPDGGPFYLDVTGPAGTQELLKGLLS